MLHLTDAMAYGMGGMKRDTGPRDATSLRLKEFILYIFGL